MNNNRRLKIQKCIKDFYKVLNELNLIIDEEEDVFDNIPENLQSSFRNEETRSLIDDMQDASSQIEDAIIDLESLF